MDRTAVIHKEIGQTPLEAAEAWKKEHGLSADFPVAYAGRLDPMAEGKLLLLIGDECKKQKEYTGLDKEYVVEVVLGVSTDTGDALGIPTLGSAPAVLRVDILRALQSEIGTHTHAYPVFSSKTVKGKPLFMYALENTLDTISIPEHPETIYKISLEDSAEMTIDALRTRVESSIARAPVSDEPSKALGADFRIGTISPAWEKLFEDSSSRSFVLLRLRVVCGSGAYMRTLAERIGQALNTSGFALSINRTRIGSYLSLPLGFGYWTRLYA